MTVVNFQVSASQLLHRNLLEEEKTKGLFIWEETLLTPFDELIISWEAERPSNGSYLIQASLFTTDWSPWLDYACWEAFDQYTFKKCSPDFGVQVYQDIVEVLGDNKASGFRVRLIANEEASLEKFRVLHASAIDRKRHAVSSTVFFDNKVVKLEFPGLSQMTLGLSLVENSRLCSPTSTTAVIRFLSRCIDLSPVKFAAAILDSTFDIYGNWILNTAEAAHVLGKSWHCYVAHLTKFDQIIDKLIQGYPVVVSVKGPLKRAALPYESGHLLVVTGYDPETQEVYCMDPAFSTNALTHVRYSLTDFLTAWGRRQGVAYIFEPALRPLCQFV